MAFYKAGTYDVLVQQQGLGINEKTQNPYFFLGFLVLGQDGRVFDESEQLARRYERAITEKTVPYLAEDVKVLGLAVTSPAQLDPKYGHSIIGKTIPMYCKIEKDDKGREWERWSVPYAGGSGTPKSMLDEAGLQALDKKFQAAFSKAMAMNTDDMVPF